MNEEQTSIGTSPMTDSLSTEVEGDATLYKPNPGNDRPRWYKYFVLLSIVIGIGLFSWLFMQMKTASSGTSNNSALAPTPTSLAEEKVPNVQVSPTQSPAIEKNATAPYKMNVLVLSYFPLTADGANIDLAVTGDWGASYQSTLQKTRDQTKRLAAALEKGSRYQGYKNPQAPNALAYNIIAVREYTQAVPMQTDGSRKPDYQKILNDHDICKLVTEQGVNEVWLWAYQGPTYPGSSVPYLNISESKMSSPFGDISNSYREDDMPDCGKTYRLYVFNYQRGTAEALHSWGHQLESEMKAVDEGLYAELWQGRGPAQTQERLGRCGDVHHPPNSRQDYDYENPTPQESDCLAWTPEGNGNTTQISCQNWGCQNVSDTNNAHFNYLVWNLQNMPGIQNDISWNGVPLRNWWDVHGDFDAVMSSSRKLTSD